MLRQQKKIALAEKMVAAAEKQREAANRAEEKLKQDHDDAEEKLKVIEGRVKETAPLKKTRARPAGKKVILGKKGKKLIKKRARQ